MLDYEEETRRYREKCENACYNVLNKVRETGRFFKYQFNCLNNIAGNIGSTKNCYSLSVEYQHNKERIIYKFGSDGCEFKVEIISTTYDPGIGGSTYYDDVYVEGKEYYFDDDYKIERWEKAALELASDIEKNSKIEVNFYFEDNSEIDDYEDDDDE